MLILEGNTINLDLCLYNVFLEIHALIDVFSILFTNFFFTFLFPLFSPSISFDLFCAYSPLPSIRSLWFKVCAVFQYSEHKLVLLKTCKPLCYLFTGGGAPDTIKSKEQAEEEESDTTVYQRRRSPSPAERYGLNCINIYHSLPPSPLSLSVSDEGQSIASLIQDLVKLSQTETKPQVSVHVHVYIHERQP